MTVNERPRTQKRSERVALDIVHDIVGRGLRSGDRLPLEAGMLEKYRVSRASLREALRLLEVQGLIRLKPGPGGGPVVGRVDARHLARTMALYLHLDGASYLHVLDAQVVFEPLSAGLAAWHPDRDAAMTPFLDVPDPETVAEFHAHTRSFHEAVHRLAANPVVSLVTKAVTHIVSDQVLATMDPVELRPAILGEHADLARAIASGDVALATRLMAEHYEAQRSHYVVNHPGRLADLVEWR